MRVRGSWSLGSEGSEDEGPDHEDLDEVLVDNSVILPFDRITVRVSFVRGSTIEITYDEWEHPYDHHGEMGIIETTRNGLAVERFTRITGGESVGTYGGNVIVKPMTEHTGDEIVTGNVTHRIMVDRTPMKLVAHYKRRAWVDPDTREALDSNRMPEPGHNEYVIEPRTEVDDDSDGT